MALFAAALLAACAPLPSQNLEPLSETDWRGCLTRSPATVARVAADRVRFCGRIVTASVAALRAELREGDRAIEIASLGGELEAPVWLGEIVLDRRLDVVVIGPCLSGCASYVFVAGATRSVWPTGWLGLHNTNSSAAFLARRASGADLPERDAPLLRRAERERMLYRARRVSETLLLEPQARIGTACVRDAGLHGETRETEYAIASREGFWVPTRAQWRAFGVEVEGYIPANAREAVHLARESVPARARDALQIAFAPSPMPAPAPQMLEGVRWCQ